MRVPLMAIRPDGSLGVHADVDVYFHPALYGRVLSAWKRAADAELAALPSDAIVVRDVWSLPGEVYYLVVRRHPVRA